MRALAAKTNAQIGPKPARAQVSCTRTSVSWGMVTGMLLSGSVFEDLNGPQDLADLEGFALEVGDDQTPFSASPVIARQIEAEIPFLRRVVRRWQRDATDAEDLIQETLLRALANAHLWQPGTNLRAWLATIMRNQFFATMSRSQRWAGAAEMIALPEVAPADAETRLTLRDVERAFHRLPTKQRAAVLLAGIEGKSYAEVASRMGLSVDAVRCHLARARDSLRSSVYRADERSPIRGTAGRATAVRAPVGIAAANAAA